MSISLSMSMPMSTSMHVSSGGPHTWQDRVYVAGTTVLTISMVPTMTITLEAVNTHWHGEGAWDKALVTIAFTLMAFVAVLMLEQYVSVHKLRLLRGSAARGRNRLLDHLATRYVINDAETLERRLQFLLERFKATPIAMRWHFVQLLRQFLLTLLIFGGDFFSNDEASAFFEAIAANVVFVVWYLLQMRTKPFECALTSRQPQPPRPTLPSAYPTLEEAMQSPPHAAQSIFTTSSSGSFAGDGAESKDSCSCFALHAQRCSLTSLTLSDLLYSCTQVRRPDCHAGARVHDD